MAKVLSSKVLSSSVKPTSKVIHASKVKSYKTIPFSEDKPRPLRTQKYWLKSSKEYQSESELPGGDRAWIQVEPQYAENHPEAVVPVNGEYYRAAVSPHVYSMGKAQGMTETQIYAQARQSALAPIAKQVEMVRQGGGYLPAAVASKIKQDINMLSTLYGEDLFNRQIELGLIPQESVYIDETRHLTPAAAKELKESSPELYETLITQGWQAYQDKLTEYEQEYQKYQRDLQKFEDSLQRNFPDLYSIYKEKGYDEYLAEVEKRQAEYDTTLAQIAPYGSVTGAKAKKAELIYQPSYGSPEKYQEAIEAQNYDLPKFLRDNPDFDTMQLTAVLGFDEEAVKAAQEYNQQPFTRKTAGEELFSAIKKVSGGEQAIKIFTESNAKVYGGYYEIIENSPELTALFKEATRHPPELEKPILSSGAFRQAFLDARGYDANQDKSGSLRAELDMLARMEYQRLYGEWALTKSGAIATTTFLFSPARVLYPEVYLTKERALAAGVSEEQLEGSYITPTEWAIGAAQIAVIGAPMIAAPFGAVTRAASLGIQAAAGATFATVTALEWSRMTPVQRAISLGFDLLIIGGIAAGIGSSIRGRIKPTTNAVRTKVQGLLRSSNIPKKSATAVDNALKDIVDGIAKNDTALIQRGTAQLRKLANSISGQDPFIAKMIQDGGSYIEANAGKYSNLITQTRVMTQQERLRAFTRGGETTRRVKPEMVVTDIEKQFNHSYKIWDKHTQQLVDANISKLLDRIEALTTERLGWRTTGEVRAKEKLIHDTLDLIRETKKTSTAKAASSMALRLEAQIAKLDELVYNRIDQLTSRLNWIKKGRNDNLVEVAKTNRDIERFLSSFKDDKLPVSQRENLNALDKLLDGLDKKIQSDAKFKMRMDLELGKIIKDIQRHIKTTLPENDVLKWLDRYIVENLKIRADSTVVTERALRDISGYLRQARESGLTTSQRVALGNLDKKLESWIRHVDDIVKQRMDWQRQLAKTIDDIDGYLEQIRKSGIAPEQKAAIRRLQAQLNELRKERMELTRTIEEVENFLSKARESKYSDQTIKDIEEFLWRKEKGIPGIQDEVGKLLRELEKKKPNDSMDLKPIEKPISESAGRTRVKTKTRTEPKVDKKVKEQIEEILEKKAKEAERKKSAFPGVEWKKDIRVDTGTTIIAIPTKALGSMSIGKIAATYGVAESELLDAIAEQLISPFAKEAAQKQPKPSEMPSPAKQPQPTPQPVPRPLPRPEFARQPEPEKKPKPQPKPKPLPKPIPLPFPRPVPAPLPQPEPQPRPQPEPKRPTPPKTPKRPRPPAITLPQLEAELDTRKRIPLGSLTWAGGQLKIRGKLRPVWKYIPPPWKQEKPKTLFAPPVGAKNPDSVVPKETIQVIGKPKAKVPKSASVDLGIADVFIDDYGKTIRFEGEGEKTVVGTGLSSSTKGMSVPSIESPKFKAKAKARKRRNSTSRKLRHRNSSDIISSLTGVRL